MTIEELKDLIDSTINENGTKAITGKALNLALNEITNAVAEAATTGGGGGGGVKRLYIDASGATPTDPVQIASNAALYTEIVTALTNNELPPQVGVSIVIEGMYQCVTNVNTTYNNSEVILLFLSDGVPTGVRLTSDGNVSMGG